MAFEMEEFDGARAIDWLLANAEAENLFWEPDLAWIADGGACPLELVQKYAGRCPHIHAKDLAPAGENEDQMGLADVGYGTLDWTRCCRPAAPPAPSISSLNTISPKIPSPVSAAVASSWQAGPG